jgi:hypothetical protein
MEEEAICMRYCILSFRKLKEFPRISLVGHAIRPRADETPASNLYMFENDFNGMSVRG